MNNSQDTYSVYIFEDGFRICKESEQEYKRECSINSEFFTPFKKFRVASRQASRQDCLSFARECLGDTLFSKLF